MDLFSDLENTNKKDRIGKTSVIYKDAATILTEGKGFMAGYDYSLNPYSGCSFGCTYCYAVAFARSEELRQSWGYWVQVKENALQLLKKYRKKPLIGKTIYMSSVTDPYQPIEKDIELTRSLLIELLIHQPRLVIQTRSPLVTRDIDLLKQFEVVQVNMTITSDSEKVRKVFEPLCPSNAVRFKTIKEINDAGIQSCITMTPLLPIENPESFAKTLLETGIKKFIIQPFHADKGKYIASTREAALDLIKQMDWNMEKYESVLEVIQKYIPNIGMGKDGFAPI